MTTINTTKNLLDEDVPNINTPLLKPKKYNINNLVERSKEKTNNLFNKTKEKVLNLFDKYNPMKNKEKITNWYNNLKENVLDIFDNIQGKDITPTAKFVLDKEALNVTKRYQMDLKKFELSLYDPISLLRKIKPLVIKKFKKYPGTKQ